MAITKKKEAHIWKRDQHDWYVEPIECSLALFSIECILGPIWDPACGMGRILWSARQIGLSAIGSDVVARTKSIDFCADFLGEVDEPEFRSIVSNPPFGVAEDFVRLAIDRAPLGGKVAMLLPLVWMAGFSTKRDWLPASPLRRIYPISPRPSMPPGAVIEAGIKPGNGTKDFAWFVWEIGFSGAPEIRFLNTKPFKPRLSQDLQLEMEC